MRLRKIDEGWLHLLQLIAGHGDGGARAVAGLADLLLTERAVARVAGQRAGVLARARPLAWQLTLCAAGSRVGRLRPAATLSNSGST